MAGRTGGVYGMFGQAAADALQASTSYTGATPISASDFDIDTSDSKALDLVFLMDSTGSMGSYIREATKNIETICDNIIQSEELPGNGALRVGLIAYRDHPPQDHTYVVKNFGFSSEVQTIKEHLKSLYASGGGDGPEASTAAMKAAVDLDWRPQATKLAVLITDAPPHGIGEIGDGFPEGSPDNEDPLWLARRMAAMGISLFVVACEPALSGYQHATDFYQGLVKVTGGMCVPLTTASLLSHVIIAAAGEVMDLERLHRDIGDDVAERLRTMSLEQQAQGGASNGMTTLDDFARELHEKLLLRNENTKQLHIESIYRDTEESRHNIEIWAAAPNLATARPHIKRVIGSRLSDKYLSTRQATASLRTTPSAPFPHPRNPHSSTTTSLSPPASSRKMMNDFGTFSVEPGISVSASPGTSPNASQGSTSVFSSPHSSQMRGGARFDDDDDDEEEESDRRKRPLPVAVSADGAVEVSGEDGQRLAYRQGAISLEQARRFAMQSAYRGGLG